MKSIRCYIEVCLVKDLIDDSGQIVPASQILESKLLEEYETVEFTDEQFEYLLMAYCGGQLFTLDELREDFNAINKRITLPRLDYIYKLYKQHDLSDQLEKLKHRIYAFVKPILDDQYELMFRSDYEYKVKDNVVYRHYGNGKKSIVLCLNKNITHFASDAEIVEERAFHRCQYLKEVNLYKVKEIKEGAFCGCLSLSDIVLSDVLTEIGNDAFMGCHFLKEIILPISLESIGEMAFCECRNLTHIVNNYNGHLVEEERLHPYIKHVGRDAFSDTPLEYLSDNTEEDPSDEYSDLGLGWPMGVKLLGGQRRQGGKGAFHVRAGLQTL